MFEHVKTGDTVVRNLAGILMPLKVLVVTEEFIYTGNDDVPGPGEDPLLDGWKFDRKTGIEVDEELGWSVATGRTGSYLVQFPLPPPKLN